MEGSGSLAQFFRAHQLLPFTSITKHRGISTERPRNCTQALRDHQVQPFTLITKYAGFLTERACFELNSAFAILDGRNDRLL